MAVAWAWILLNASRCSNCSNGTPVFILNNADADSPCMRDARCSCQENYIGYLRKMHDYNLRRKELVAHITHRPCKRLISVTGIAILQTSQVWLGCSVRVSETAACPRLVPQKITPKRRLGMGPGVMDLLGLRGIPSVHPRLQSFDPNFLGGSSLPRPTANRQAFINTCGKLKSYVTLTD
jgi:hypothetical protein